MDAYIGEIRALPYTFPPDGWFPCDGRQVPIQQYQGLFATIGFAYGGDHNTYFNLPDLRGQVAAGAGGAAPFGNVSNKGGVESVTLSYYQNVMHNHSVLAYNRTVVAQAVLLTNMPGPNVYLTGADTISGTTAKSIYAYSNAYDQYTLHPNTLSPSGSVNPAAHENRQPFVNVNYCICWNGYYAPRP